MYSNTSTANTYNYLLNGRWHSGTTPDSYGQLQIEKEIIENSGMNKNSVVLDFGCGNGIVSTDYHLLTGATVYGVTNQPSEIETAYAIAEHLGIPATHLRYVLLDNGIKLPFQSGFFDIVVFTESPCHIKDKHRLFREFRRVLKPSGCVVGEDWAHMNPQSSSADRINTDYRTYLVKPTKYKKIGNRAWMDTKIKVIKPVWEQNTMSMLWNRLRFGTKYKNTKILSDYPFKIGEINPKLIDSGFIIQSDPDFRLVIVTMRPWPNIEL